MSEKYHTLQTLAFDTFYLESPVEITRGELLLDKTTRDVLLLLNINILTPDVSSISSITITVECKDDAGDVITDINPFKYTFMDVFLLKSKSFGENTPVNLDKRVRRVNVKLSRVVFMDGSVWYPPEKELTVPTQTQIDSMSPELWVQFQRNKRSLRKNLAEWFIYLPLQLEDYWVCTCGRPNINDSIQCCRCGNKRESVFKETNEEYLKQILGEYQESLRLEEESARAESERRRILDQEIQARLQEENRVRSKTIKISLLYTAIAGALVTLFLIFALPAINYNLALQFLSNKDYNKAIFMFYDLDDYKNSKEMLNEANYQKAADLLTTKQYDEAAVIFSTLEGYKNSKEMVDESSYQKAIALLTDKKFDEALKIFSEMPTYMDSVVMVNEVLYQQANDLLAGKNFDEALRIFSEIPAYKDSQNQITEIFYQKAVTFIKDSKYQEAVEMFVTIKGYRDSESLLMESKYLLAQQYQRDYLFPDAKELFIELGNYKESQALLKETEEGIGLEQIYQQAIYNWNSGKFSASKRLFASIQGYRDSDLFEVKSSTLIGFQGTWHSEEKDEQIVIIGWNVFRITNVHHKFWVSIWTLPNINASLVTEKIINYEPYQESRFHTTYRLGDTYLIYDLVKFTKISDTTTNQEILGLVGK